MNCKIYQREVEHLESMQTLSADISAHVESCAACFEFKREHDSLQNLIGNLERVNAPANFDAKLRARLVPAKTHHQGIFTLTNFSLLRPAMGVGFALVLLFVGVVFIKPLLTDENKPLNVVAEMSPLSYGEMNANEIIKIEKRSVDELVETDETSKRYAMSRRNLARVNKDEEIFAEDKSSTGAVASIEIPFRTDSRSQFVFLNDKKVPLRSVSFGLPTFVDGKTVRTSYASDSQGVW